MESAVRWINTDESIAIRVYLLSSSVSKNFLLCEVQVEEAESAEKTITYKEILLRKQEVDWL
jgi:hypothetical protein